MTDDTPCIWPGCSSPQYDAEDEVFLCRAHLIAIGTKFVTALRHGYIVNVSLTASQAQDDESRAYEDRMKRLKAASKAQEQVYYVRMGERIKIGYTNNVRARMTALRVPVTAVLATEPGGRDLERMRHKEFAGLRDGRREEFFPHDRLTRHIDYVRETFGPPKITTYPKVR